MNTDTLNACKKVIKEYYNFAQCGIYDCHGTAGDEMANIYDDGRVQIDICFYYGYFEVFGLSISNFAELEHFYEWLGEKKK